MSTETQISRNAPCPCGSNKKYKRCCGANVPAPNLAPGMNPGAMSGMPPGFDPSKLDPAMISQMQQMMKRLPKGQLQRLQSVMQRAMAGKDVTEEAEALEKSLPPDFQEMMRSFNPESLGMPAMAEPEPEAAPMTEDDARKIVEQAMKEGKISAEEAAALLKGDQK